MTQIWKFPLSGPSVDVKMPAGAIFRFAGPQQGVICLWFQVDPAQPKKPVRLLAVKTGQDIPDTAEFLATVSIAHGRHVHHIFQDHDCAGAN